MGIAPHPGSRRLAQIPAAVCTFVNHHERETIMQPYSIGGLILIVLGILALSIHSVTYFTTEHVVGPLGFFAFEVSQPHTIFINPIVGIAALAVGIGLVVFGRTRSSGSATSA